MPVPAPPAENGDPALGVSVPSACRSNAAIVLVPAVLSLTYTCPTTGEAPVEAEAGRGHRHGRGRRQAEDQRPRPAALQDVPYFSAGILGADGDPPPPM